MQFHELQKKVIASMKYENPKIMICSGAKRSGKTYVLTFVFLMHISKFKDKGYSFIIACKPSHFLVTISICSIKAINFIPK